MIADLDRATAESRENHERAMAESREKHDRDTAEIREAQTRDLKATLKAFIESLWRGNAAQ